jgi:hypothetical protein
VLQFVILKTVAMQSHILKKIGLLLMPTTRLSSPDSVKRTLFCFISDSKRLKEAGAFKKQITSGGLEMNSWNSQIIDLFLNNFPIEE